MTCDEALAILVQHREELRRHKVRSLAIFGSVARNEARPDSDIDILVEFEDVVGIFGFVRLKRHLEGLLGVKVDLATPDGLRDVMKEQILREAVRAA